LLVCVALVGWNALLALQCRGLLQQVQQQAQQQIDTQKSASGVGVGLEEKMVLLEERLNQVNAASIKALQRDAEGNSQRLLESVSGVLNRLATIEQQLTSKMNDVLRETESLKIILTGRDNAEGVRTAYQRHALTVLQQRAKTTAKKSAPARRVVKRRKLQAVVPPVMPADHHGGLPTGERQMPELLVLLPTFLRAKLRDHTEYLRRSLRSLVRQYRGELVDRGVEVLVVNNAPYTHVGVRDAVSRVLKEEDSLLQVKVVDAKPEFDDPFPPELKLKAGLPGRPDLLESWEPSRRHCRHFVEALAAAEDRAARYVLVWEDDMEMCGTSANGTLRNVFDTIDAANTRADDWTGLRLGFGGNGIVLQHYDLVALADYILSNMHRKPPDWLITEWYKGLTYQARMSIGDRHRGFTHELNFFSHIGNHSSFPGRENQGAEGSESHVNYKIPGCFERNWWLLPAERFAPGCTGHSLLSPC